VFFEKRSFPLFFIYFNSQNPPKRNGLCFNARGKFFEKLFRKAQHKVPEREPDCKETDDSVLRKFLAVQKWQRQGVT